MKRHVFNVVAVLSLLLCVAATALWVRSYFVSDTVYYRTETRTTDGNVERVGPALGAGWGQFYAGASRVSYRKPSDSVTGGSRGRFEWVRRPVDKKPEAWGWFGFYREVVKINNRGFSASGQLYYVPSWSLVLATAALPIVWCRGWLRRGRLRRERRCSVCGYDLRATPSRCPECGAAPRSETAAA